MQMRISAAGSERHQLVEGAAIAGRDEEEEHGAVRVAGGPAGFRIGRRAEIRMRRRSIARDHRVGGGGAGVEHGDRFLLNGVISSLISCVRTLSEMCRYRRAKVRIWPGSTGTISRVSSAWRGAGG